MPTPIFSLDTSTTNPNTLITTTGTQRWRTLVERHPEIVRLSAHQSDIVKALGISDFISQICHQYPSILLWLFDEQKLTTEQQEFDQEFRYCLQGVSDETTLHRVVRQFRQKHMVRIAWLDLVKGQSIESSLAQVSKLANTLIVQTYQWLHDYHVNTHSDNGVLKPLLILGMGKLGGEELNFSSDVDLIFLSDQSGAISIRGKSKECSQLYTKLAQSLITALDKVTADGRVFRIDMRLRPYGESGPLVMSLGAFEEYLQDQGRDWERFAMMKARLLNPSQQHLLDFEEVVRPFVFRKYLDFGTVESLRRMKQLIAQEVRRKQLTNNIKLGSGGIRDIEFIVQSFQLIQGGKNPSIRIKQLLNALQALHRSKYISLQAFNELRGAYLWLRKVEHSIQQFADEQSQTLPDTKQAQASLLASLDLTNSEEFVRLHSQHLSCVTHHFNALISENVEHHSHQHNADLDEFWLCVSSVGHGKHLGDIAIQCAPKYAHVLPEVVQFRQSLSTYRPGAKGAELLDKLLPQIIETILTRPTSNNRLSDTELLTRVLPIVKSIARRTSYLQMIFENRGVIAQLIKLCEASPWVAHQITSFPLLLDELLDPSALQHPPAIEQYNDLLRQQFLRIEPDDMEMQLETLRQFKLSHQLRVAVADISGLLPIEKVSDQLTALAQSCLFTSILMAWQQVTARYGSPAETSIQDMGLGVIGYGKLGGYELGYGSDLDLVFVHDERALTHTQGEKQIEGRQFYAKLVQRIMHILTVKTASGQLYEVDLRLRPSGNSGLIVCSTQGYESYLMQEAWTWEHQALVRARFLFGNDMLAQTYSAIRNQCLSITRNDADLRQDITNMRDKMMQNLTSHAADLKHARGGLVDIEFLVQYWILRFAAHVDSLAYWTDNLRLLERLSKENLITKQAATCLSQAYVTMRNHIHHCTLAEQTLPFGPEIEQMKEAVSNIWNDVFDTQ